jgi:hypothetical protein
MDRALPKGNIVVVPPPGAAQAGGGTNALDIRGIKGPVKIPSSYAWIGWTLLAIAGVALAWYLWRRFRNRKREPKAVPSIPPHRKAKDRLRNAEELYSDPYAFCSLVSDVTRGYLEDRFELHAPERTTEEFLEEMRSSPALAPEHKALLEDFLARCDLVKFARFEPTQGELKGLLEAALRFIDETTPGMAATVQPAASISGTEGSP